MLFLASFKLALMWYSCMLHLLPWVASCSLAMHHTLLSIMSCLFLCVYHVVCFFPVVLLLDSSCFVGIMRIRSSMLGSSSPVRLLHGLVLLPSGILGKMTVTLDLTTIIAMLVALFYHFAALPIFCSSSLPNCHEPLTFDNLPSKPLFGYVTAFAQPSYSVVSCRWRWRFVPGGNLLLLVYHNIYNCY